LFPSKANLLVLPSVPLKDSFCFSNRESVVTLAPL
jgi:hypothetical protein